MLIARHDVYILSDTTARDPMAREASPFMVRPGTIAVSACTPVIRFRNMTGASVAITFPPEAADWLRPSVLTLAPGDGQTVQIIWPARPAGVVAYTVTVEGTTARGNSEPTIIFD